MVGCGIENVNLLASALKRHTKQVQVIVFERDDMVIIKHFTTAYLISRYYSTFVSVFFFFFFRTKMPTVAIFYVKLRHSSLLPTFFLVIFLKKI